MQNMGVLYGKSMRNNASKCKIDAYKCTLEKRKKKVVFVLWKCGWCPDPFKMLSCHAASRRRGRDISGINDAGWLVESISALIYQRHKIVFACHMEDIQFQTTVSSVWKEGGEFRVAWPCQLKSETAERINVLQTEARKPFDRNPTLQGVWFLCTWRGGSFNSTDRRALEKWKFLYEGEDGFRPLLMKSVIRHSFKLICREKYESGGGPLTTHLNVSTLVHAEWEGKCKMWSCWADDILAEIHV